MIFTLTCIVLLAIIVFLLFVIYFNRDPIRVIPPENNIVSPADGTVLEVIDLLLLQKKNPYVEIKKGMVGKIKTMFSGVSRHGFAIVIFMSPLNVHVQRAPLEGEVVSVKHTKGKFLAANSLNATLENEKNEILIKNKDVGCFKVIQAAGFFTKRIESFVKKGDKILKGQRIGRIKLGSQVVLILPDVYVSVKKGDKVTAGETVVAEYK